MNWLKLNEHMLTKYRKQFIRFFLQHGDKHITKQGLSWLNNAQKEDLKKAGNYVVIVLDKSVLVGIFITVNYGLNESFIAVHRQYRHRDIASDMIQLTLGELGKLYGRVATDNTPSLTLCMENGLVAFALCKGPTGKSTLWLGGGDWSKNDIA